MSDPISKTVKIISTAHNVARKPLSSFVRAVSNPDLFPKTAATVVVLSTMLGVLCMQFTEKSRQKNIPIISSENPYGDNEHQKVMSHNESLVRAMVENAKTSSLRENLENAAMAQKHFMLVPSDTSDQDRTREDYFMNKINKRSEEIRDSTKSKLDGS